MSDSASDASDATDDLGGFTISLGEFGYMTKKYEKELQDFKDAEAAAEEAEAEAAEAADDNAVEVEAADDNAVEGEAAGDNAVEGEEKDDSTSIAPKLPNDYPAAWAECSISAEGSATLTDVIWHPVDQAVRMHHKIDANMSLCRLIH